MGTKHQPWDFEAADQRRLAIAKQYPLFAEPGYGMAHFDLLNPKIIEALLPPQQVYDWLVSQARATEPARFIPGYDDDSVMTQFFLATYGEPHFRVWRPVDCWSPESIGRTPNEYNDPWPVWLSDFVAMHAYSEDDDIDEVDPASAVGALAYLRAILVKHRIMVDLGVPTPAENAAYAAVLATWIADHDICATCHGAMEVRRPYNQDDPRYCPTCQPESAQ